MTQDYSAPTLVVLGTVADVTQGNNTAVVDAGAIGSL